MYVFLYYFKIIAKPFKTIDNRSYENFLNELNNIIIEHKIE